MSCGSFPMDRVLERRGKELTSPGQDAQCRRNALPPPTPRQKRCVHHQQRDQVETRLPRQVQSSRTGRLSRRDLYVWERECELFEDACAARVGRGDAGDLCGGSAGIGGGVACRGVGLEWRKRESRSRQSLAEGADSHCVRVQDPEDHEDMPYQDFSDIIPDQSIGVVLFSFQMRRTSSSLHEELRWVLIPPSILPYAQSTTRCSAKRTTTSRPTLIASWCSRTTTPMYSSRAGAVQVRPFQDTPLARRLETAPNLSYIAGEGAMASVLFSARKNLVPIIVGKPHQPLLDIVHEAYVPPPPRNQRPSQLTPRSGSSSIPREQSWSAIASKRTSFSASAGACRRCWSLQVLPSSIFERARGADFENRELDDARSGGVADGA